MFSLQLIQKKIDKFTASAPKDSGAKRKKTTEPKSPAAKKRHMDMADTNTSTTTGTKKTRKKRNRNRGKAQNRSKSDGESDDKGENDTPLTVASSLPILYVNTETSVPEQEVRPSVNPESLTETTEYVNTGSKTEEQNDSSYSSEIELWGGGKHQFDHLYDCGATEKGWKSDQGGRKGKNGGRRKRNVDRLPDTIFADISENSSDLELFPRARDGDGPFDSDCVEVIDPSSDSEMPWGVKMKEQDMRAFTENLRKVTERSSDSERRKKDKKNRSINKYPKEVNEISSDSEVLRAPKRKEKKKHGSPNLESNSDLTSDVKPSRRHREPRKNETKHNKKREIEANRNAAPDVNQRLTIGECIATTTTESGTVIAALHQSATLYLQGSIRVTPLLGTVEVLGYKLRQGESQVMYSLPTASLLGVTAVEARTIDGTQESLDGVDAMWLEGVKEKTSSAVILEVSRHSSPRVSFLVSAGWGVLGRCLKIQRPWNSIGASVVTRNDYNKYRVTRIPPEWREAAQTLVETLKCGSVPYVIICGGKSVGKSTFFKYLANTLLSATPETGVTCLDFDPGQPELSLPTALSLTHLTQPLLGPPYALNLDTISSSRTHKLVGAVSPQFILEAYGKAVRDLCDAARERASKAPILVNTMGWTQRTGLGLMLDVLRVAKPTHVMQIQSPKSDRNFPFFLEAETVRDARGGITTSPGDVDLHYGLTILPCATLDNCGPHISQPKALRELRVLAEAGQAVESESHIAVPWANVALHVCEDQVPRDRILQVLNAQLVALCRVELPSLCTPHPDLPQLLLPGAGLGDLLGWGVVMGVDPLASKIHLATALSEEVVHEEVNALIMPQLHLPAAFYKLFSAGKEGPYLQKEGRNEAARLRVGRNFKPRRK